MYDEQINVNTAYDPKNIITRCFKWGLSWFWVKCFYIVEDNNQFKCDAAVHTDDR